MRAVGDDVGFSAECAASLCGTARLDRSNLKAGQWFDVVRQSAIVASTDRIGCMLRVHAAGARMRLMAKATALWLSACLVDRCF